MENITTFSRNSPFNIRMTGSGEYVKKECARLVETFQDAEDEHYENIRQDNEE